MKSCACMLSQCTMHEYVRQHQKAFCVHVKMYPEYNRHATGIYHITVEKLGAEEAPHFSNVYTFIEAY